MEHRSRGATTAVKFSDVVVALAPGAMDAMSGFVFVTIATPGIVHLFGRPQEDVDD
jgi:hypothetical protein